MVDQARPLVAQPASLKCPLLRGPGESPRPGGKPRGHGHRLARSPPQVWRGCGAHQGAKRASGSIPVLLPWPEGRSWSRGLTRFRPRPLRFAGGKAGPHADPEPFRFSDAVTAAKPGSAPSSRRVCKRCLAGAEAPGSARRGLGVGAAARGCRVAGVNLLSCNGAHGFPYPERPLVCTILVPRSQTKTAPP